MFNFLCELHFWTKKDGIIVENSDFGAFVYHDRGDASGSNVSYSKSSGPCPILEGKKIYSEGRGVAFSLTNKRKKRLKDSLADLEDMLQELRIVCFEWSNSSTIRMVFENGHRTCIKISPQGDVENFVHDKFMVGKLASGSYLSDVAIHTQHAVFAFTDNLVTHVHIPRPSLETPTRKWSTSDVKLLNVRLAGPSGRRLDKTLSFTAAGDSLLVWWKATRDEVYPWSPQVHAQDRANVHIYSLNGAKFDLLCYYKTKFEPIQVMFSQIRPSTVYTLQQKVSDDGEVSLEWEVASLDCRTLRTNFILSLPLPTHVSALALSPKEDKLLATCIDGSLLVADSYGNITNKIRTNLIPSMALWHPDGALIVVANGKGQLQWFDSALAPVSCQLVSTSVLTSVLDVGSYFKYQPNLVGIHWNPRANNSPHEAFQDFLLFQFEKGPLVVLKVMRPLEKKLSPDTLIYQYLSSGAFSCALNLLHTIDWEVDSELAMSSLHSLMSFLLRKPLSLSTESAIEKSLGYFLNPIRPIPEEIITEVEDGVLDLARKFFHQLLRYQRFDKAFMLAIDLGKYDLFMDLYHYSKDTNNKAMAAAAWERADELACSSCEDGSGSSCDCSESHSSSDQSGPSDNESESTQDLQEKIAPPLEIRSPLESSRHRVCYSTILQQHNFRRNPPTNARTSAQDTPNPVGSASDLSSRTSNFVTQPRFVHDYFRQDSKGIYLPIALNDDTMFTGGNCVVHHPNVPSSRAPLQFLPDDKCSSLEYNDDGNYVLSSLSSDNHVTQSLKVANARRSNGHPSSNSNSDPRSTHAINPYPAFKPQNCHSIDFQGRSQPDGYSYSRNVSETQLRGVRTFEKLPKLLTGQGETCQAHSPMADGHVPSENGGPSSDTTD
ncbi:unnamed protein product, partial [Nesidiocoris tenuis]